MPWYEDLYAAVDGMDAGRLAPLLTQDSRFRFGNREEVVGRDEVVAATVEFWKLIGGMKHTIHNVLEVGDLAAVEATVAYTRLDGSAVQIPLVTLVGLRDGDIAEQRVYIDVGPLFDPIVSAGPAPA